MFSMPPAIATLAYPATSSAALAMACAPDPQTRLTVTAGTCTGRPPPMAAWRAGFTWPPPDSPGPAPRYRQPHEAGRHAGRFRAPQPRRARVAGVSLNAPPKVPIGARTGAQRTISGLLMGTPCRESGLVEDEAGRGGMRIDLSVGADDPTFGHGNLPSDVDQLAFRTHKRHLIVESAKHVHLELQGGSLGRRGDEALLRKAARYGASGGIARAGDQGHFWICRLTISVYCLVQYELEK